MQLSNFIRIDRLIDVNYQDHLSTLELLIKSAIPHLSSDIQFHAFEEIRSRSDSKEINLGSGFAMSHLRLEEIQNTYLSVGLLGSKTDYLKGDPVHTVFCILIPQDKSREYLSFMTNLSRFLMIPEIEKHFLARNHSEIINAIAQFDQSRS